MEWREVNPLPDECLVCNDEDCYNCDYAGMRWQLSQEEDLQIRRKGLLRAIERLEKQVNDIDQKLQSINNAKKHK